MSYENLTSISPYYDDFTSLDINGLSPKDKNYLRVLFVPGRAVQARELTQAQTILQTQIGHFANHFFKNNSPILGGKISVRFNKKRVKIDTVTGGVGDTITEEMLQNWIENKTIFSNNATYADKTATMRITHYDFTGANPIIYYELGGPDDDIGTTWYEILGGGVPTANPDLSIITTESLSDAVAAENGAGLLYVNNHFVIIQASECIVSNSPNELIQVGYRVFENIVTTADDSTLADNAAGSTNVNAPGGARYQLTPILTGFEENTGLIIETDANKSVTSTLDSTLELTEPEWKTEFAQYIVLNNGSIVEDNSDVNYSDILDLLAERTYDESGNYTVSDFDIRIKDNADSTKLTVEIGPGKAFVHGYEVHKQQSTTLEIDKALTTKTITGAEAYMAAAPYVVALSVGPTGEKLEALADNLDDGVTLSTNLQYFFTDATGTKNYGTTKILAIEKVGDEFRLYTNRINHVIRNKSVIRGLADQLNGETGTPTIKLKTDSNGNVVYNAGNSMIYPIQDATIVVPGSITPTIFETFKRVSVTGGVDNDGLAIDYTINRTEIGGAPNDFIFGQDYSVSYAYNETKGEYIDINGISTANVADNLKITITTADAYDTVTPALTDTIVFNIAVSNENGNGHRLTKTLTTHSFSYNHYPDTAIGHTLIPTWTTNKDYITNDIVQYDGKFYRCFTGGKSHTTDPGGPVKDTTLGRTESVDTYPSWVLHNFDKIKLLTEDNYRIVSITQTTNVVDDLTFPGSGPTDPYSFTDNEIKYIFTLLKGNNARFYYYYGRLLGFNHPALNAYKADNDAATNYDIVIEYFDHSGDVKEGAFFSVDSYMGAGCFDGDLSKLDKVSIGNKIYDLINCIDFRRKKTQIEANAPHLPRMNTDFNLSYQNYLPRTDIVYADSNGNLGIVKGIPSPSPEPPKIPANAMALYILYIPPYTFNADSVKIEPIQNLRYTMSDIRDLENRIRSLEENVSLSALEKLADGANIIDPNTGLNKFKSGIFTDPLENHNIGNTGDPDYRIAIDIDRASIVCPFSVFNSELELATLDGNTVIAATSADTSYENLITLPLNTAAYPGTATEPAGTKILAQNNFASGSVNVNPYLTFKWQGNIQLTPGIDIWYETRYLPVAQSSRGQNNPGTLISNITPIVNDVNKRWIGESKIGKLQNQSDARGANVSTLVNDEDDVDDKVATKLHTLPRRDNSGVAEILPPCAPDWITLDTFVSNQDCDTDKLIGDIDRVVGTTISSNTTTTRNNGFIVTTTVNESILDVSAAPYIRPREVQFKAENLRPGMWTKLYFDGVELVHGTNTTLSYDGEAALPTTNISWAISTSYSIGDIVKSTIDEGWYKALTAGTSAGDDSNLDGGSDTGVSWKRINITDSTGMVSGTFTIPSKTFISGTKTVEIEDYENTSQADTAYTSKGVVTTKQRTITSTRTLIPRTSPRRRWKDPIAQSFLVEPIEGVFLNSIDIYFKTADSDIPVSLYIVAMENGIPTSDVVPFSMVTLLGVNSSTTVPQDGRTNFQFSDPVYLQGQTEYAFVVFTNSENYEVWTSTLGELDIFENGIASPGKGIARQPYLGSLFKSQNSTTWTPDQGSDITFRIHQCKFLEATRSVYFADKKTGPDNVAIFNNPNTTNISSLRVDGMTNNIGDLVLNNTTIDYYYDYFSNRYLIDIPDANNYESVVNRTPVDLLAEYQLNAKPGASGRSYSLLADLTTTNENITPVIDKQQLSVVTTRRLIFDETNSIWGAGQYVSPTVPLENGADEIRVLLDARLPGTSYVDVYYRTTEYTPEYIVSKSKVPTDLNGKKCYISSATSASDVLTIDDAVQSLCYVGNSEVTSEIRVYLESIQNRDADYFNDTPGSYTSVWVYSEDLFIARDTVTPHQDFMTAREWILGDGSDGAGLAWAVGDITAYAGRLWVCEIGGEVNIAPTINGEYWSPLEAYELSTTGALFADVDGNTIIQEDPTDWQKMKLVDVSGETTRFFNSQDEFYSYEFEPSNRVLNEFSDYAIKIELKAVGNSIDKAAPFTPEVKNIRAIAVI